MDRAAAIQCIQDQWMTFIMRGDTAAETLAAVEAVIQGGSRVIEVAFTTPAVCTVIKELRRRHGDVMVIAAGTLTTLEQTRQAVDAGANVVVSPDTFPAVIQAAVALGAVSGPGCMTPSEVSCARRAGADIIKISPPCYIGGPDYIRFLRGPFPGLRTMPAGAIRLDNMDQYFQAGAFAAVAGVTTEMALLGAVKDGRFQEIAQTCRTWLSRARAMLEAKKS